MSKHVALGLLIVAVVSLAPAIADACPVCAADDSRGAGAGSLLVALFLLAPFVIASLAGWLIARWIRDRDRDDRREASER